MSVTADEVKAAALAAGIERVDCRNCSMCGYPLAYYIHGERPVFDPGCDCTYGGGLEPRTWGDMADWINMQSNQEQRNKLRIAFGLEKDHP